MRPDPVFSLTIGLNLKARANAKSGVYWINTKTHRFEKAHNQASCPHLKASP
jgi:hypothetical protein